MAAAMAMALSSITCFIEPHRSESSMAMATRMAPYARRQQVPSPFEAHGERQQSGSIRRNNYPTKTTISDS